MAVKHLIELQTTDNTIIAEQIVALLSTTFLIFILFWVIVNFKKEQSLNKPLSLSCIVSITCFTLFALVGSIGWTNVIFPISPVSCKIIYPLALINYNIAKISMYWLLTFRIQVIFEHSALAYNTNYLRFYRLVVAIIPSILWCIWIYLSFIDLKPHKLTIYSHCFPLTFRNISLASHISGALAWSDLIFSAIAVYIFIYKLYQVTHLANNNMKYNLPKNKLRHSLLPTIKINQKWINTIWKCTVLCIIAIVSTWIYVLGTTYILKQCVFFISFDGVINAICLSFLFNFADTYYNKCFRNTFVRCCIDIICCYCCKKKKKYHQRETNISIGGATGVSINAHKNYDITIVSNADDLNDFILSSSEDICNKDDDIENILMNPTMDTVVHIEDDSVTSANTIRSILKEKEKNKKRNMSNASFSPSESSGTFMLLDMSEEENDEYYEVDQVLQEEDETQITDEDDD